MPLVLILLAVVLFLGMVTMIWIVVGLLPLIFHLIMAGLVGALANAVVRGALPWGWVGAVLAGLLGSWLGTRLVGDVGPVLFDVPLIPALVGAVLLAVAVSLLGRLQADRHSRMG